MITVINKGSRRLFRSSLTAKQNGVGDYGIKASGEAFEIHERDFYRLRFYVSVEPKPVAKPVTEAVVQSADIATEEPAPKPKRKRRKKKAAE